MSEPRTEPDADMTPEEKERARFDYINKAHNAQRKEWRDMAKRARRLLGIEDKPK